MGNKEVRCPKCKSLNCTLLDQDKRTISGGKALVGAALLGPIGLAAGLMGKKAKYLFYCNDCGRRFDVKG